jgi:type I restriction enzyme S subunit
MANREGSYPRASCAVFSRTTDRHGGLSNMAGGFPIQVNGVEFRTSEALYQACRFPAYPGIQRRILRASSPLVAKWIARGRKKRYGRKDWNDIRDQVMMWCLRAKLACNYDSFGAVLRATGAKSIVEESRRDRYWGAVRSGSARLVGVNRLGEMLGQLRKEYRAKSKDVMVRVKPPHVHGFRLMGVRVRTIRGGFEAQ